ncbi:DNA recombination and repair protein RecO [Acidisarcina polymorpha]|uniref:DNA repair protein RecO n=1 Tax=Acidisarcina polymorpha TaxID=2211140 RepID=A0A2Z5G841_9BACT|nr:DNA repair protein RecO [Acidisarcina polymorpha]AXC15140.1 DNA recombination and repair protein RecO [Acidisarcina polymorpha]
MIAHQVEAIVLRTWPIHEADQIVSLFTRDYGKIKGVAKSAARSRRRFGGALEPMTHVRASYAEKPRQELVRLDSFDIVTSPLSQAVDYGRASALAFYAEVLEETLPDHDPQDAVFRLLVAVLAHTRIESIWMPITYFTIWTTRLMGWLPDLTACVHCGTPFAGSSAWYHQQNDGLFCQAHRPPGSSMLSVESQSLAHRILRSPVPVLAAEPWPRTRAADLRRFGMQALERHIDRRLKSATALHRLSQ